MALHETDIYLETDYSVVRLETELFFTKDPRSNFHFFVQARNGKIFLPTRTREPSLLVRVPSARVGRPHPRLLQGEPKQLCVP